MRSLVLSGFLYACESWTLTAKLQRRIKDMKMRCYRKVLRISYKDHVTNEGVPAKIQQAIGLHEDLLTTVKWHKLQWYGLVSRSSSGLAKVLQGRVKGGRRQGRQRKRWDYNVREWTGLEFAKSQRAMCVRVCLVVICMCVCGVCGMCGVWVCCEVCMCLCGVCGTCGCGVRCVCICLSVWCVYVCACV